ncbi:3-oxoacyl-[acyl-carrier-protein] reductase FabG [bacterium BMS3Abin03]|nr:3-oxoacyl-[acyl-carrier-protein] reductase FabG [bacterium BMS3Abin03]
MKKELLIFGANGALGRGVTKSLISKDYDKIYLFASKFDSESAIPTIEQIKVHDLSVEENVSTALGKIEPAKDKVLYLFSTVGGFSGGKNIWETDSSDWDKMMDKNLKSGFFIAKYFSLLVSNSHSGSICFTSAFTGLNPEAGKGAYGVSKAALIHLIKTLSEEGKEIHLSANAIAPFIIDTLANREWMKDADYDSWMKPEEIGELIHSIFNNYNFVSGNVFELKNRFNY